MSLNASLNTAVTGLQANQTQLRVLSANITNANVEGYTRKIAALETLVLNGLGAGVKVADIRRTVDNYLVSQSSVQSSASNYSTTLSDYYTRLEDLFGSPEQNSSIAGVMNELRVAFEALSLDPSRSVEQFSAVSKAEEVASMFQSISRFIQGLRAEADKDIDAGISIVNDSLIKINELNIDIVKETVAQQPLGDLQDRRDQELATISEMMDIKWFVRSTGELNVLTGSNFTLLDSAPRPLDYTASSGISKATVYPGGFRAIELPGETDDLTPFIRSGKIAALIELRDTILPDLQNQIDQLAESFANEINRAHNSAMPIPGLQRMTGERIIASTELLDPANPASLPLVPFNNGTITEYGTLQFAIIDENGDAVGEALRVNLDEFQDEMEAYILANGGGAVTYQVTLGDVINMINGAYAATPPTGIPVPPTPAGWPGAVPWPPAPPLTMTSTGSDIAGLYNLSGASVSGGLANGAFAGMSAGRLVLALPSTSPYGLAIDDTNSTFDDGGSQSASFNYLLGMNNLFTIPPTSFSASDDIAVRADIVTDPARIGRGHLTSILRDPLDPTTEEWYVARGDGEGARAMADAFNRQLNFASAGTLPGSNQSLTEYAADVIQSNARATTAAENDALFRKDLLTNINSRIGSASGVNIDEELANLVNVQNNYAASARIVTSVNAMYEDLLRLL